jgi:hypothetical protein
MKALVLASAVFVFAVGSLGIGNAEPVGEHVYDFAELYSVLKDRKRTSTSIQWKEYERAVQGVQVKGVGWVFNVKERSGGVFQVLIDIDPPGSLSMQDLKLKIPERIAYSLNEGEKIRFTGTIIGVGGVFGKMIFSGTAETIRSVD